MTDADRSPAASWLPDILLAVLLFLGLMLLRPAMPDGDGLGHSARAVQRSLLTGMETKHILYAPLLRCVLLALEPFGLRPFALEAFTLVSNLAGVAVYLLLARAIFAPLLRDLFLARVCALGTLLSYGVLSECCSIETYALALALDVALVAVCLHGLTTARRGAAAGVLFVLAVGIHSTNALVLPFVLALFWNDGKRSGWRPVLSFLAVTGLGAVLLATALVFGAEGGSDWRRLLPHGDRQPALGVGGHLSRAAYGVARTVAWLPPISDLTPRLAVGYGALFVLAIALIVVVARRGFVGKLGSYRPAFLPLALLALPFAAIGIYYFPSDPERWLFLLPAAWLIVGRIWADDAAPLRRTRFALVAMVLLLGVYNGVGKLWPEARHDRGKQGMEELARRAKHDDLVVALHRFNLVDEFVLRLPPFTFEILAIGELMTEHGDRPEDVAACQKDLRRRITEALDRKQRVLVFGLFDEGHVAGRGHPWAHVNYTPDDLLDVLKEFQPEVLVPPNAEHAGTFELHPCNVRAATVRERKSAPLPDGRGS
jgi:hypothetical protein